MSGSDKKVPLFTEWRNGDHLINLCRSVLLVNGERWCTLIVIFSIQMILQYPWNLLITATFRDFCLSVNMGHYINQDSVQSDARNGWLADITVCVCIVINWGGLSELYYKDFYHVEYSFLYVPHLTSCHTSACFLCTYVWARLRDMYRKYH